MRRPKLNNRTKNREGQIVEIGADNPVVDQTFAPNDLEIIEEEAEEESSTPTPRPVVEKVKLRQIAQMDIDDLEEEVPDSPPRIPLGQNIKKRFTIPEKSHSAIDEITKRLQRNFVRNDD